MTDHEDEWTPHPIGCECKWCDDPVTHKELVAESARVITVLNRNMAKMGETMRDQIAYLHKTHTVALMAGQVYATRGDLTYDWAADLACKIYRSVQEQIDMDATIAGRIPAA